MAIPTDSLKLVQTAALAATALLVAIALPSSAGADEIPRTSWGAPDLQGTWDFRSITPFERPKEFGDKEFLTAEEIAEWEEKTLKARADRRNRDPVLGQGDVDVGYNAFWLDRGEKMTGTLRTSLVVDPPDGRIPALTDLAKRRSAERYALWGGVPGGPEDRNPLERCIMGFNSGPPMNPGAYNNFLEVFQTPTHVALLNEMINDHRIIPLDGRDHVPDNVRLWKGDSRGRWEGETLVVTTRNFTHRTNFRGSGPNMVLVERFTRNSENSLLYEYTVEDPESFEKPWSVAVEMKKTSDPLLEYACHEGNRAMFLMLSGARVQEQKGKTTDDWLATWYGGSKAVKAAEEQLQKDAKEGSAEGK